MTRDMRRFFETGLTGFLRGLTGLWRERILSLSVLSLASLAGASGTDAVNGDFGVGDLGAGGELPEVGGVEGFDGVGIGDEAAGFAMKVDVLLDVGAVTGLSALNLDEFDQSVAGEVL